MTMRAGATSRRFIQKARHDDERHDRISMCINTSRIS